MEKMTVLDIQRMKEEGRKIAMITAYDATFARIVDGAGVEIVLVGDSLGMVVQGEETTIPVTLDQMVYHTRCVRRGIKRAHLCTDMPFLSYHLSSEQALATAGRLVQEGGAESVKLEGGEERAKAVEFIVRAGIPVMGHIGLTPQSVHVLGGFKVQGRGERARKKLMSDARALEQAGAFSMVLESIPAELGREITESLSIPTIGIGAGPFCDGQVLVLYDLLGMDNSFKPKFVKRYANLEGVMGEAVGRYVSEVKEGIFPGEEQTFHDASSGQKGMRIVKR